MLTGRQFKNDCPTDALKVAEYCKKNDIPLWGVRLDTSGTMVDKSLIDNMSQETPTGVTSQLVNNVRERLDTYGYNDLKIIVSGGFTADKIKQFELNKTPVDSYGVGSSLLQGNFDYTADIVTVEGLPMAKAGRHYNPPNNLTDVNLNEIYNTE